MSEKPELRLRGADDLRRQLNARQKREMRQFYLDVYNENKNEIERLKSMPQSASVKMRTMWCNQVGRQLSESYKSIYSDIESNIVNNMTAVSAAVINESAAFWGSLGVTVGSAFGNFSTEVVEDLYFGKVYKGDWTLSKAIWGDYKGVNDDISRIIAKGVAEGKGTYDIAKALETYVNPNAQKPWNWSRFYPGSKLKVDYNAVRLARTEISHAYQQSLIRTAAANPFASGIKRHAADHGNTCDFCKSEDGKVYPVDDCPLDHPNGFCTFTIQLEKSLDKIADEIVEWVNGGENKRLDDFVERKYIEKPKKVVNVGLTGTGISGIINKGKIFNTTADPMREVFGSAEQSNPEEIQEMIEHIKSTGAEFERPEHEKLCYEPALVIGQPGKIVISQNASYSAWLHEIKHLDDDMADGWLGMRVLEDDDKCIKREMDAYEIEIQLAKKANRNDIVQRLEALRDDEIKR